MPKFSDFDLDVQNTNLNQLSLRPLTEYCPSCVSPNCTDNNIAVQSLGCQSFYSEGNTCRCVYL